MFLENHNLVLQGFGVSVEKYMIDESVGFSLLFLVEEYD